jgi:hypothetical protein
MRRENTSRSHMSPLGILSRLRRGLSARCDSLMGLVRDTSGVLLPSAISGGAFFCFQSNASRNPVGNTEWSTSTDLLLVLVLVTYSFCDTACSTALGVFTARLIAPFWNRVRERHPASSARSAGGSRSLRQWLCSPSRNEKCARPCHSMQVSHNRAPPLTPSFFTHY